jgi:predicted Zn-dependent protease
VSHEVVEQALALSVADDAVVIASETTTANLRWANNTLTTNGSTRDKNLTVISIMGRSFGVRSATLGTTDVESIVRASEADARAAGDAVDFGELVGTTTSEDFEQPADPTSITVFDQLCRELGEVLGGGRHDGIRFFGFANHEMTTTWLGTSKGARLRHTQPTGSVDWTAKNDLGRGSVWHGQSTKDFTDVSALACDEILRKRLGWCENEIDLAPGRYETILPPTALADLAVYMYWSASGRDAAEGRNAFSAQGKTRVGEKLAASGFNMFSDPSDKQLGATPFVVTGSSSSEASVFDNGASIGRTDWIKDGVLNALVETGASSRERGVAFTPPADNLFIDAGGTKSIDEMIANTERGLLLTCLWYIREVDPQSLLLTGLTRDGVYLIEDGEIAGVVNNFRFNESPIDLLGRITETGAPEATLPREWGDWFTLARVPPARIPDFNMSTVSPAS